MLGLFFAFVALCAADYPALPQAFEADVNINAAGTALPGHLWFDFTAHGAHGKYFAQHFQCVRTLKPLNLFNLAHCAGTHFFGVLFYSATFSLLRTFSRIFLTSHNPNPTSKTTANKHQPNHPLKLSFGFSSFFTLSAQPPSDS